MDRRESLANGREQPRGIILCRLMANDFDDGPIPQYSHATARIARIYRQYNHIRILRYLAQLVGKAPAWGSWPMNDLKRRRQRTVIFCRRTVVNPHSTACAN